MPTTSRHLSPHAVNCLEAIFHKPRPSQDFNPGVIHQLMELNLAEIVQLPSPYKSHKPGTMIGFLSITENGKLRVKKWGG